MESDQKWDQKWDRMILDICIDDYDYCIESAGHSREYHIFHREKAIVINGIDFGSGTEQHNLERII